MTVSNEMKKELDRLSLKYFGASSRWKKMSEKGQLVPTLNEDGSQNEKLKQIKRLSPEEILDGLQKLEQAQQKIKEDKIKDDTIQEVMQKATGVLDVKELSKRFI